MDYLTNTRGKPLAAENLTTFSTWQVARRGKRRIRHGKVLGKEEGKAKSFIKIPSQNLKILSQIII